MSPGCWRSVGTDAAQPDGLVVYAPIFSECVDGKTPDEVAEMVAEGMSKHIVSLQVTDDLGDAKPPGVTQH